MQRCIDNPSALSKSVINKEDTFSSPLSSAITSLTERLPPPTHHLVNPINGPAVNLSAWNGQRACDMQQEGESLDEGWVVMLRTKKEILKDLQRICSNREQLIRKNLNPEMLDKSPILRLKKLSYDASIGIDQAILHTSQLDKQLETIQDKCRVLPSEYEDVLPIEIDVQKHRQFEKEEKLKHSTVYKSVSPKEKREYIKKLSQERAKRNSLVEICKHTEPYKKHRNLIDKLMDSSENSQYIEIALYDTEQLNAILKDIILTTLLTEDNKDIYHQA